MGFLKKSRVPNELPDLALNGPVNNIEKPTISEPTAVEACNVPSELGVNVPVSSEKKEVAGEDYLEVEHPKEIASHGEIKKQISEHLESSGEKQAGFFDQVLNDVNGEIEDLGKLEEWYEKKFLPQDVVSSMRGYWEGNKADILIKSFGAEYKAKINEKIKELQVLEEDWREIYFKLVKKEEEMKKVERELKETLSEFVDLCKRRKDGEEEK